MSLYSNFLGNNNDEKETNNFKSNTNDNNS